MHADESWSQEGFEDAIARALIACFETRVRKNRGAFPADRLDARQVAQIQTGGIYLPGPSRYVLAPERDDAPWAFDLVNDPLPTAGCVALQARTDHGAWLQIMRLQRCTAMGRTWRPTRAGSHFEAQVLWAYDQHLLGERSYVTVTHSGKVVAATQEHMIRGRAGGMTSRRVSQLLAEGNELAEQTACTAAISLQYLADQRFCWTISAREGHAQAHLGCEAGDVKSLLYARSLPLSATGRRRPILHLVAAHRRRLAAGIDIDVTAFLRGVQAVEIAGTQFVVRPPSCMRTAVSSTSQRRYFDAAGASPSSAIR